MKKYFVLIVFTSSQLAFSSENQDKNIFYQVFQSVESCQDIESDKEVAGHFVYLQNNPTVVKMSIDYGTAVISFQTRRIGTLPLNSKYEREITLDFKNRKGLVSHQSYRGKKTKYPFLFKDLNELELIFCDEYEEKVEYLHTEMDRPNDEFNFARNSLLKVKDNFDEISELMSTNIEKEFNENVMLCSEAILNSFNM